MTKDCYEYLKKEYEKLEKQFLSEYFNNLNEEKQMFILDEMHSINHLLFIEKRGNNIK